MRTIAVWHGSIDAVVKFGNLHAAGACELTALIPDPEMRFAWWGFYRVNEQAHKLIRALPKLTYKDGDD